MNGLLSFRTILFSAMLLLVVLGVVGSPTVDAQPPASRVTASNRAPVQPRVDAQGRRIDRRLSAAGRVRDDRGRFMSNEAVSQLQRTDPGQHAQRQSAAHERVNRIRREVGMPPLAPIAQSTPAVVNQATPTIVTQPRSPGHGSMGIRERITRALDSAVSRARSLNPVARVLGRRSSDRGR